MGLVNFQYKTSLNRRSVLITGASSGMGKSLAMQLSSLGADLILVAQNQRRLQKTASEVLRCQISPCQSVKTFSVDISKNKVASQLVGQLNEIGESVDMLINNASFCYSDYLDGFPSAVMDRLMSRNLRGAIRMARAIIPLFKEQGVGQLVNISSIAALIRFSEVMANELAPNQVWVSTLLPPDRHRNEAKAIDSNKIASALFSNQLGSGVFNIVPDHSQQIVDNLCRQLLPLSDE